jgi:hypothetical protein
MGREDLTVVYYTHNRERPEFEARIQSRLLKMIGDMPLISVSQKPIDFGTNICVGDIGPSNVHYAKQLHVGVVAASTKFVCVAESDFVYPPEYFTFLPEREDAMYLADHLYIIYENGRRATAFVPRPWSGGALISSRDHLVSVCEKLYTSNRLNKLHHIGPIEFFHTDIPIVTFKTNENMHQKGPILRGVPAKTELPYWGTIEAIRREYFA